MAKPIVATNVSDLPTILDSGSLIVEPDEPTQLQGTILKLFFDETLREELGQAARKRCVKHYSYDALAPVVDEIVITVADE